MTNKRYALVLKMVIHTMDELGDKKASFEMFMRLTMQYGKKMDITTQEILEVLHLKPFDMIIKKGE